MARNRFDMTGVIVEKCRAGEVIQIRKEGSHNWTVVRYLIKGLNNYIPVLEKPHKTEQAARKTFNNL